MNTPTKQVLESADIDQYIGVKAVSFCWNEYKSNATITKSLHDSHDSGVETLEKAIKLAKQIAGTNEELTPAIIIMKASNSAFYLFLLNHTGRYSWRQYTDYGATTVREGCSNCEYRTFHNDVVAVISGSGDVLNNLGKKRFWN